FIDEVDARYMDKCIVKPESFKKLYLVQSSKNENDLGAIITVSDEIAAEKGKITRAVWVEAGNINFASKHGGKLALEHFRGWLNKNTPDLLKGAELKSINAGMMEAISLNLSIANSFIGGMDESKEIDSLLIGSFNDWKSGKKDW
ncbi:MAG: hypothetical protein RPR91_03125, partial [Colwellia sp.]